jgi:hypothetical protein
MISIVLYVTGKKFINGNIVYISFNVNQFLYWKTMIFEPLHGILNKTINLTYIAIEIGIWQQRSMKPK